MQMSSSLSTRLQYQHKCLVDIIDGLTDEQIRRQVITGKWSIFENIVHLQTYQHKFVMRIREMLEKENPLFDRYTADADPEFLDNVTKTTRDIMHDMITIRNQMVVELLQFPKSDLLKTGTHPVFGQLSVEQWLNFFLLHEAHHLLTIFKLSAELKKRKDTR